MRVVSDLTGPRQQLRRGPVVISDGWACCDRPSRGPSWRAWRLRSEWARWTARPTSATTPC